MTTNIHRLWSISELRHPIFELLDAKDLAHLSRTSKLLFDLAAEELWRTKATCEAFLSCLPEDCRRRPLVKEDTDRLCLYSAKIQNLTWDNRGTPQPIPVPPPFRPITRKNKSTHHATVKGTYGGSKTWEQLWVEVLQLRPDIFPILTRLHLHNVSEDLLYPLIGSHYVHLRYLYLKTIHGPKSRDLLKKLVECVQGERLDYLYIREPDLIPTELIARSPLTRLRFDIRDNDIIQRINQSTIDMYSRVWKKESLKFLSVNLDENTTASQAGIMGDKVLPNLIILWLNLTRTKFSCICGCRNNEWRTCPSTRALTANAFLRTLHRPRLHLLNVKFPSATTASMLFDIVSGAVNGCHVHDLTELGLLTPAYSRYRYWGSGERPMVTPPELRQAVSMFFPLPRLKRLHISVAPNFLDVLDIPMYRSITDAMPELESLWLGSVAWSVPREHSLPTFHDQTLLVHAAAFCSLLPKLVEVQLGCCNADEIEAHPSPCWRSPNVEKLKIESWSRRSLYPPSQVSKEHMFLSLQTYFPRAIKHRLENFQYI